jgi:hypothetical protein
MYMQMLNEVVDTGTDADRRLSQAKLYKASASRTISFSTPLNSQLPGHKRPQHIQHTINDLYEELEGSLK